MRVFDGLWWGQDIKFAISDAISSADKFGDQCCFNFNGVKLVVAGNSRLDLIHRDWQRAMNGYLGKDPCVGPYPCIVLSQDEIDSDRISKMKQTKRDGEF